MAVDWHGIYRAPAATALGFAQSGGDIEEGDLHPTLDWKVADMPAPQRFDAEELAGDGPMVWFRRLAADPTGSLETMDKGVLREVPGPDRHKQTVMDMLAIELEAEELGAEGTGFLMTLDDEDDL